MKLGILKTKRARIFAAVTLAAIVLLIVLNLLLYSVGLSKAFFFDMTPEGLYTLSDAMVDECDEIFDELRAKSQGEENKKKIKVTFCTDVDYLLDSRDTRLTYFMALKLQNKYSDLFEVKTVNVRLNPTAVSEYKTTSLSQIKENNVIVSYGERYRIVTDQYFWTSGTKNDEYYNGEYRIASLMKSVTSLSRPAAYFLTGHGETVYDPSNKDSDMSKSLSSFAALLGERGLEIKLLDLSQVNKIPDDCALLIINNPTKDFSYDDSQLDSLAYQSEAEIIDRYLVMRQGAMMVSKDYRVTLPILESYLYEWGFDFSESVVVDKESSLEDKDNTGTHLVGLYDTNSESYGYAIYGEYADLSSAPLTIIKDTGSINCSFVDAEASLESGTSYTSKNYVSFLTTSQSAQKYFRDEITDEITSYIDGNSGKFDIAALSVRKELDSIENVSKFSYIFAVNSSSFLENSLIGDPSYANYEIVSAVVENISRVDEHASMDLGALSLNSASGGGKYIIDTGISETDNEIVSNKHEDNDVAKPLIVIKKNHGMSETAKNVYISFVFAVPVLVGAFGIYVCLKRRFL